MEYAVVVIDIGMTNKKVAVYDDRLVQIEAWYRVFDPVMVEGLSTHDLEGMEEWFIDRLRAAAASYPIKALAVTTHGATFACVDALGKPCVPCVYYTHEPGDQFHDRFYSRFGKPEDLQTTTGTPYFKAMINLAKGILFAQERFPDAFANTAHLFNYPQYWGYRFTGKAGAEGTYTGCHTYLWDWMKATWSTVAEGLALKGLIPGGLNNSWDALGTISAGMAKLTGLSADTIVTMGIHDSNSSLLPHFAKKGERGFVLNSTGTWCVIMNPVERYGFSPEELGKVVFFNQSAFRTPVKTAIFLGGQEFETWSKLLMDLHGRKDLPAYQAGLYRSVMADRKDFILPELTAGSGQFPGSLPRVVEGEKTYPYRDIAAAVQGDFLISDPRIPPFFRDYERGIAVLRIDLVMQTLTALDRSGLLPGAEVYTEGGFRKDEAYNTLLSAALPTNGLFLTDLAEATAFGAAMTAKMALSGARLFDLARDFSVEYTEVPKTSIPELANYRAAWLSKMEVP